RAGDGHRKSGASPICAERLPYAQRAARSATAQVCGQGDLAGGPRCRKRHPIVEFAEPSVRLNYGGAGRDGLKDVGRRALGYEVLQYRLPIRTLQVTVKFYVTIKKNDVPALI